MALQPFCCCYSSFLCLLLPQEATLTHPFLTLLLLRKTHGTVQKILYSFWATSNAQDCSPYCDGGAAFLPLLVLTIEVMPPKCIALTEQEFANRNHLQKTRFQKQRACYFNQHHIHPPLSTCTTYTLHFRTWLYLLPYTVTVCRFEMMAQLIANMLCSCPNQNNHKPKSNKCVKPRASSLANCTHRLYTTKNCTVIKTSPEGAKRSA